MAQTPKHGTNVLAKEIQKCHANTTLNTEFTTITFALSSNSKKRETDSVSLTANHLNLV